VDSSRLTTAPEPGCSECPYEHWCSAPNARLAVAVSERFDEGVVPVTSVRLTAVLTDRNRAVSVCARRRPARRSTCKPAEVNAEPMGASVVVERARANVEQLVTTDTVDELVRADASHGRRQDLDRARADNARLGDGLIGLANAAGAFADIQLLRKNDRLDRSRRCPLTARVPTPDKSRRRDTRDREGA